MYKRQDASHAGAAYGGRPILPLSAETGAGLDAVLAALEAEVAARYGLTGSAQLTRARHREALTYCLASLDRFLDGSAPDAELDAELAAEDIRLAARSLGRITGRVGVEDMLDIVFRDFCIGK